MFTLYYYPNNASLAPHFLLHHLEADYQLVLVDRKINAQHSDEYRQLNPAGRIPTLVVQQQAIFESAAICIHLCELHPHSTLMPELGNAKRPLFFQWLTFLTNTLQSQLMVRYYPQRHTNDPQGTTAVSAAQEERIGETLSIIDQQLSHNHYLLGDTLSACDYFLFMLLLWSLPLKTSPLGYSHLARYLQHMSGLASIRAVCAIEGIDLSQVTINSSQKKL